MLIAKCPYCNTELEADESYDFSIEDDHTIDRVAGHCPLCRKEFQWEEIYKYHSCKNLEEVK